MDRVKLQAPWSPLPASTTNDSALLQTTSHAAVCAVVPRCAHVWWFDGAMPRSAVLPVIKAVHTLAWLSIESCVLYVLYAGFAGRTDKRVAIAGTIVGGEALVFAANGFRCPLTEVAERYGAESGSVTDIYLPRWFAHNLPAIHTPLLVLMAYLHARNLRRSRQTPSLGKVDKHDP